MPRMTFDLNKQQEFLAAVNEHFGKEIVSGRDIDLYAKKNNYPTPYFIYRDQKRKVSRGMYSIAMAVSLVNTENNTPQIKPLKPLKPLKPMKAVDPKKSEMQEVPVVPVTQVISASMKSIQADVSCSVPDIDPTYVPFGNYKDIETIIKSRIFFPVYITGLSGNGKTMSIMQACAKLKRELLRINVTEETDELDLIGGTELIDGNTVNREGAVLLAMRRGSILLIDEGDLNNTKILCLMPILEGKPYFNKKTGEVIHPAEGFNIFITGNTKGKGSEDGRFVGTKVMNEAFLERFSITMEQEYPVTAVEKKIIIKNMQLLNCVDDDFATKLCTWAELIRKSFFEGIKDELISTRRLVHIVKAFSIFGERLKAVKLAINRFDSATRDEFLDLYTKCDASVDTQPKETPIDFTKQSLEELLPIQPTPTTILPTISQSFSNPNGPIISNKQVAQSLDGTWGEALINSLDPKDDAETIVKKNVTEILNRLSEKENVKINFEFNYFRKCLSINIGNTVKEISMDILLNCYDLEGIIEADVKHLISVASSAVPYYK